MKIGVFPLFNQGANRKSLIHIDDLVQGIVLAAENQPVSNGQIYNIAAARPVSILEIHHAVARSLGKRIYLIRLPLKPFSSLFSVWDRLASLLGGRLPLLKRNLDVITSEDVISINKIQDQLGFHPEISAEQGLISFVAAIEED